MAIKRKPKTADPDELPAARLDLDDVRELANILTAPQEPSQTNDNEWTVSYRVRDLECDNLEDLSQIGGRTRNFEITLAHKKDKWRRGYLRVQSGRNSLYLPSDAEFSAKRDRIKRIFDGNSIWWKGVLTHGLDHWASWVFIYVLCTAIAYIAGRSLAAAGTGFDLAALALLVLMVFRWSRFASSIVVLQYSHQRGNWFRDHQGQIGLIVLGTILGILGTLAKELISKAVSRLWH
jgi:hypothetical protein